MKNLLKLNSQKNFKVVGLQAVLVAAIFLAVFLFVGRAQASVILDGTDNTGGTDTGNCLYGFNYPNGTNGCHARVPIYFLNLPVVRYGDPGFGQNFGSTHKLLKITLWLQAFSTMQDICQTHNGGVCHFRLEARDPSWNVIAYSTNAVDYMSLPTNGTYEEEVFTFDAGNTIDFSNDLLFDLSLHGNYGDVPAGGNFGGDVSVEYKTATPNGYWAYCDWYNGIDCGAGSVPRIKIEDDAGEVAPPILGIQRPAIIIPGILGSQQKNGQWVMDPILYTYDNLINTLRANGYVDGQTIFGFPYDWRQSNVTTAGQLKVRIDYVKSVCSCDKVDLVAHSMGGLVARQYIESNAYQNDVNQLIFVGTPHEGAPKSYLGWESGNIGVSAEDKALQFLLEREGKKAGFSNLYNYIHNEPIVSLGELLPMYSYIEDSATSNVKVYPNSYPRNQFLEDLNNNVSKLYNSGVKITNIIGNAGSNSTINQIKVVASTYLPLWPDGYPQGFDLNTGDHGLIRGPGDGTVPEVSSTSLVPDSIQLDSNHSGLPAKAEGLIFKQLTGLDPTVLVNKRYFDGSTAKILFLKVLSPVDIQIIAPDGRRIGKDFTSGQEIDEILDAFYSGFETDNEFVAIPNPEDGQYQIITQGTGSGEYTIASGMLSDDQDLEQDVQAQTTPGQMETLDLNLSAANNTLKVTPQDTTPPQITINSPKQQDYLRSASLPIGYLVSDDGSGVFSQSSKFDSMDTGSGQSIDLFYQALGVHTFTVQAHDNVGNQANSSVNLRVIATVDSTISDINRAYDLGWINKKSVRDELLKKFNSIIKIETKKQSNDQKDKKIDKILAKLLVKGLKDYQKDRINEQAYNLFVEDINWLINN